MSQPDMGSIFTKIIYEIFCHRKLLCEFLKLSKFYAAPRILVYKVHPERTGFNMYAEYAPPQLTFLALVLWIFQV